MLAGASTDCGAMLAEQPPPPPFPPPPTYLNDSFRGDVFHGSGRSPLSRDSGNSTPTAKGADGAAGQRNSQGPDGLRAIPEDRSGGGPSPSRNRQQQQHVSKGGAAFRAGEDPADDNFCAASACGTVVTQVSSISDGDSLPLGCDAFEYAREKRGRAADRAADTRAQRFKNAGGQLLIVPDQYATLREALDASPSEEEGATSDAAFIRLRGGVYREDLLLVNKPVTIEPMSSDPNKQVVIEGRVQFVAGGETAVMRRIVVRGPVTVHE